MSGFKVGDVFSVKEKMDLCGDKVPIAYGIIYEADGWNFVLGFYDQKLLFAGKKTIDIHTLRVNNRYQVVDKDINKIAYEYTKELERDEE